MEGGGNGLGFWEARGSRLEGKLEEGIRECVHAA